MTPEPARRADLIDALRDLVAYVRRLNGFMTVEDQQALRRAEALLELREEA